MPRRFGSAAWTSPMKREGACMCVRAFICMALCVCTLICASAQACICEFVGFILNVL